VCAVSDHEMLLGELKEAVSELKKQNVTIIAKLDDLYGFKWRIYGAVSFISFFLSFGASLLFNYLKMKG